MKIEVVENKEKVLDFLDEGEQPVFSDAYRALLINQDTNKIEYIGTGATPKKAIDSLFEEIEKFENLKKEGAI